jgi:hypothetical protein
MRCDAAAAGWTIDAIDATATGLGVEWQLDLIARAAGDEERRR